MCLNKQDSEYSICICQGYQQASVTQLSEYARFWQNMPWQSSEYILGSKYATTWPNMSK